MKSNFRGLVKVRKNAMPLSEQALSRALIFRSDRSRIVGASEGSKVDELYAYREDEEAYYVPRFFFERYVKPAFGSRDWQSAVDLEEVDGWKTAFAMAKTFRLRRNEKCDQVAAVASLTATNGGILAIRPGGGKTVMAINAAQKRGKRVLVVVPTTTLLEQWQKRVVEHTNLRPYDVGIVQGDKCEWNRPFVIGMVQSLASRVYPDKLYDTVGTIIFDECHRMSAPHFANVMTLFPAKTRWGLSATVGRADGFHKVFEYHVGPVVFEMLEQELPAEVHVLRTGFMFYPKDYSNPWNRKPNHSKLLNALASHPARNRMWAGQLVRAAKAGRKTIALSHRLDQMEKIRGMVIDLGIPSKQVGKIIGATSKQDRERILKECRIVLAMESIAGLGLDEPSLDTLMYLTPSQNVEQNVGRIQREYPNKKTPLVVDGLDICDPCHSRFQSRLRIYNKHHFKVTYVSNKE